MISLLYGYRFQQVFSGGRGPANRHLALRITRTAEQSDFGQVMGGDHEFVVPCQRPILPSAPSKAMASLCGRRPDLPPLLGNSSKRRERLFYLHLTRRLGLARLHHRSDISWATDACIGPHRPICIGDSAWRCRWQTLPALETKDHWANTLFGIGFRF